MLHRMCKEWFRRFQSDDFSMDNNSRKSPKKFENTELDALLDETIGNHHWLQLIHLKRALLEKRPEWENRHDKLILQTTPGCMLLNQEVLRRSELGNPIPSAIFPRHRTLISLSFVSVIWFDNVISSLGTALHLIRRSQKMAKWIASKESKFFLYRIQLLTERWVKIVCCDEQCFE